MTSSSGVAVVVAGLLSTFTAVAPVGVDVIDGDPIDPGTQFLCVAWDESDGPVASSTSEPADLSMQADQEVVEVSNLLTVWSGTDSPAQVRAAVLALFDVFRAAVKADVTLGGVASRVHISAYEYLSSRRAEGFLGQVRFTVSADAFTV